MSITESKAVVYGFDERYAPAGLLSMFSMFLNSRNRQYNTYVLTDNLSSETLSKIDHIGKIFARKIIVKSVPVDQIKKVFPVSGHISAAAYFRLYAPEIINADKILWVDSDTIIHCEIDEIFNDVDGEHIVYGVNDPIIQGACNNRLEIPQDEEYINSGVLLIDRNRWIQFDTLGKCADYAKNRDKIAFHDQCILNKVLAGRKGKLPLNYNVMQHLFEFGHYRQYNFHITKFKGIIHYTTEIKPWHSWCNRSLIHFYKTYSQIAPYRMDDVYIPSSDIGKQRLQYWLSQEGW